MAQIRERFTVDVAVEMPDGMHLTAHQREAIARRISSIAHTLAFTEEEDKDELKVLQPQVKVVYGHQHESTRDYACDTCIEQARDRQNSRSIN